jgi:hypothetical protein
MSNQFDPDAPEGSADLGSQYISKKDIAWIILALVVVGGSFAAIYPQLRKQAHESACKKNMKDIAFSVKQYAEIYDGRFPPLYEVGPGGSPQLTNGLPIVWASVIPSLPTGSSFKCPAAPETAVTRVNGQSVSRSMFSREDKQLKYIDLTYGMLASLSARAVSDVANENQTVLISETSNNGSQNVYNPLPFTDDEGTPSKFDGFSIGFDNQQTNLDPESKFVTRLAFQNTSKGDFSSKEIEGRHGKINFSIKVDGSLGRLTAADVAIKSGDYTWLVR